MIQLHGQLLCFILLHISNRSVSASLVGYVLYLANLMSVICFPHSFLMVHRYIYIYIVDTLLYSLCFTNCIIPFLSQLSYHPQVFTWVLQPELLLKVITTGLHLLSLHFIDNTPPVMYSDTSTSTLISWSRSGATKIGHIINMFFQLFECLFLFFFPVLLFVFSDQLM